MPRTTTNAVHSIIKFFAQSVNKSAHNSTTWLIDDDVINDALLVFLRIIELGRS